MSSYKVSSTPHPQLCMCHERQIEVKLSKDNIIFELSTI